MCTNLWIVFTTSPRDSQFHTNEAQRWPRSSPSRSSCNNTFSMTRSHMNLCRFESPNSDSAVLQPIRQFSNLARRLVLAFPQLNDRVIKICVARLAQRELERAAFDVSCACIATARRTAMILKCQCFYQRAWQDSDESDDEDDGLGMWQRNPSLQELVECQWCYDGRSEANSRVEAAGYPRPSCDELKHLLRSLRSVSTLRRARQLFEL